MSVVVVVRRRRRVDLEVGVGYVPMMRLAKRDLPSCCEASPTLPRSGSSSP